MSKDMIEALDVACDRYADKSAFTCLGHSITYRELKALSDAFAAFLQNDTNLARGDRVAVQLPNSLQYPVVVFGILRAGMVVVNTNPMYTSLEMSHQFSDSGARALVTLSAAYEKATKVLDASCIDTVIVTDPDDLLQTSKNLLDPSVVSSRNPWIEGLESTRRIALTDALCVGSTKRVIALAMDPGQIAVLQYTGGTTGVAKGAMLSHRNFVAVTRQLCEHRAEMFREGAEVLCAPLPLYHIYAFTVHLVVGVAIGGHSILIPDPRDTASLVKAVEPFRMTVMIGINTLLAELCRNERFRRLDFSALQATVSGGMAGTDDVATIWQEITNCEITEGYGMTETTSTVCSTIPGSVQRGAVGTPVPGTELKVISEEGETLPPGEAGELCVRGPQVMEGYWQRPDATKEALSEDGWLMTGDIAVIQEDGFVRIVDRLKDMIIVSGFNVYPNEVEKAVYLHPAVQECAVIGVPDEKSGEAVKLFVVAGEDYRDSDELRRFLRDRLTAYKIPKLIEFVEELPKSTVGKILRRELR